MPYPNEHAIRLKAPGQYKRVRRQNDKFGSGIHAIFGVKDTSDGEKTELQAIRFSKDKFTVAQAKKWLQDHDYKTTGFEPAKAKEQEEAATEPQEEEGDPESGELGEYFGYEPEQPYPPYAPITSFADLDARREASEKLVMLQARVTDLTRMVNDILWEADISDRSTALKSLFDEFVVIAREALGEGASEPEAPQVESAESAPVNLAEQAAALSVSETTIDDLAQFDALLSEQHVELTDPRRAPVMVDFAIIKPGHGNQKDKRYYPAEMLERDGGAFAGVDIFVTNHDPDEKTERNKVGRFRNIAGLREEGLIGTAILYDPDVAEKARNRADAGELGTLHCSILATGTGKKAQIDGQEVTVIEAITQVHSVDLVSKAGAGGHAIALSESDGGTMDENKEQEQQDQPLAETESTPETVEIRESDAETTESETVAETALTAEQVNTLLGASGLSETAQHLISSREYADENAVNEMIADVKALIAEIAPSAGQPFALGESAAPASTNVPKVLTPAELEERARERTRRVLSEIEPSYAANL